ALGPRMFHCTVLPWADFVVPTENPLSVTDTYVVLDCAFTVVVAVDELLAGFGSDSVALTVAVLVIVPGWTGTTCTVTVAEPPFAIVPRLQLTVEVPEQLPWLGTAETN